MWQRHGLLKKITACCHCIFVFMRIKKIGLLVIAVILLATLFFPWVVIESKNIIITGMQADGTTYGKPGLLTLFFAGLTTVFSLVPRIWAHRICMICSALNAGWALRNFIILSVCQGGECPQRQPAFYLYLISSILLVIAVLIQDMKLKPATD